MDKNRENLVLYHTTENVQEREKALNALVIDNMNLVRSIVKKYKCGNMEEDLMQEGTIGLIQAIKNFDIKRTTALSTYATTYIKSAISSFIHKNAGVVRIPEKRFRIANKVKNAMDSGCVTCEEIAEKTGYTMKQVKNALHDIEFLKKEEVTDETEEVYDDYSEIYDDKNEMLDEFKKRLSTIDCDVIFMHYGVGKYDKPHTMREIADELNMSIDDVAKSEKKSKDILLHSEVLKQMVIDRYN